MCIQYWFSAVQCSWSIHIIVQHISRTFSSCKTKTLYPLINQSVLKEINPEYSLEGLMLKLQYFGHLMRRIQLIGKIGSRRKRGRQRMR